MRSKDASLVRACRAGNLEMARAAIRAGADVNVRADKFGDTPLFIAVDSNERPMVKLLVAAGADVNARADNGLPVLILACTHDLRGGALHLIKSGANPNVRWRKHSNESPLHVTHYPAVVKALIKAGADVNARDALGRTPLVHLVLTSEWQSARILIAAGVDTRMRDKYGCTAGDRLKEVELLGIYPPADIAAALGIGPAKHDKARRRKA